MSLFAVYGTLMWHKSHNLSWYQPSIWPEVCLSRWKGKSYILNVTQFRFWATCNNISNSNLKYQTICNNVTKTFVQGLKCQADTDSPSLSLDYAEQHCLYKISWFIYLFFFFGTNLRSYTGCAWKIIQFSQFFFLLRKNVNKVQQQHSGDQKHHFPVCKKIFQGTNGRQRHVRSFMFTASFILVSCVKLP